ncbi:hypothetical protein AC579_8295 [Pseudocercospora musae]|uniref:Xylanolytic transcriptional activator regulatory domain-containing protein n=1 Tax=Pseudocercospora musae TaxID=113226 RepID=A0A139HR11_9PEZI|nr:hypothetical protein AC579_8295 [Pseudocercospora musae]KXT04840.1 hypothetical protein AC579_8295 [Pseudocercospora musae]
MEPSLQVYGWSVLFVDGNVDVAGSRNSSHGLHGEGHPSITTTSRRCMRTVPGKKVTLRAWRYDLQTLQGTWCRMPTSLCWSATGPEEGTSPNATVQDMLTTSPFEALLEQRVADLTHRDSALSLDQLSEPGKTTPDSRAAPPLTHVHPLETSPTLASYFPESAPNLSTPDVLSYWSAKLEPAHHDEKGMFDGVHGVNIEGLRLLDQDLPNLDTSLKLNAYASWGPRPLINPPLSGYVHHVPGDTSNTILSAPMQADLTHVFFDRVHPLLPILNFDEYLLKISHALPTSFALRCLQHAIWTTATCFSSQFQHHGDTLYTETRTMLERAEEQSLHGAIPIELPQAWSLLAIYELKQVNHRRGCLTASHCFQLAQLMELHRIDAPESYKGNEGQLPASTLEERRRVFWVAYFLHLCVNLISGLSVGMDDEQTILTRLPAVQASFRGGHAGHSISLSEAMACRKDSDATSAFNQSIIIATLSSRCLVHLTRCSAESVCYPHLSEASWTRHEQLTDMVAQQTSDMQVSWTGYLRLGDPARLFNILMVQAAAIFLYAAVCSVECDPRDTRDRSRTVHECEQRAIVAVQSMATLCRAASGLNNCKGHPLIPVLLVIGAHFAQDRRATDSKFEASFSTLSTVLFELCSTSKLAQTCYARLGGSLGC